MNETQKKTTKALIVYCICIFVAAVALILLAWFMQNRSENEVNARIQSAETKAIATSTQLDAVRTENTRLKESVTALTTENETLKTSTANLTKQLEAEKKLSELLSLKVQKKSKSLKEAKALFEEAGYVDFLSAESLTTYNSIIK